MQTLAEFNTLATTLGGTSVAGGKMKVTGTTYFASPNTGATNESGFSAIAGGSRDHIGAFGVINNYMYSWIIDGNRYGISYNSIDISIADANLYKQRGYSLRLIKTT